MWLYTINSMRPSQELATANRVADVAVNDHNYLPLLPRPFQWMCRFLLHAYVPELHN